MTMQARHRNLVAETLACVILVGSAIAPSAAVAEPVRGSGCRVFPKSNIWNTRIDALPVHELSDTWLRSAEAGSTDLHPDFGPPSYGLPLDVVGAITRKYASDSPTPMRATRAPTRSTLERRSRPVRIGTR